VYDRKKTTQWFNRLTFNFTADYFFASLFCETKQDRFIETKLSLLENKQHKVCGKSVCGYAIVERTDRTCCRPLQWGD